MRRLVVWLTVVLVFSVVMPVIAQEGYEEPPEDAYIVPFGEPGTGYDELELGVRGGTFNYSMIASPKTFNQEVADETSSISVTSRIMGWALTGDNPLTGEIDNSGLAKGWEISPDGKEIIFHLRRGIKFNDGEPFTAADVMFTFNYIVFNLDCDVDYREVLYVKGELPKIEKIDDHTVKFILPDIFRPFIDFMSGTAIYPEHVMGKHVHKYTVDMGLPEVPPGTFNAAWGLDVDPAELVGLGPYKLVEYVTDLYAVLERNPYYWRYDANGTQLPYYDKVIIHIVESMDVSILKFRNGEIDVLPPRPEDIPVLMGEAVEKGFTVEITDEPTYGTMFLVFNQDAPDPVLRAVFRDLRFRQAMAHAMDKEAIIDVLYHGMAIPQWGPISVPSPFYDPAADVIYEFDLDKAAALLDGMGLVDTDGDGVRNITDAFLTEAGVDLAGLPPEDERELAFEVSTNAGNTLREGLILLMQADVEKIGVKFLPNFIDFVTLVRQLLAGEYPGGVVIGLTGGDDPHGGANVYPSCGPLHFWKYSDCEEPSESDKRIDEIFEQGVLTYDFEEAKKLYLEFHEIFSRELDLIYTVAILYRYAYYDYVGNAHGASVRSSPSGYTGVFAHLVFDRRLK
jgi:peptide/nickel transport system substrate-binding protein